MKNLPVVTVDGYLCTEEEKMHDWRDFLRSAA
jgi:hypothetical protein